MDIISHNDEIFKQSIMETGFYSKDLPPCFKVKDFYKIASDNNLFPQELFTNQYLILRKFVKNPHHVNSERYGFCRLARYDGGNNDGSRRIFSYPNPIFFIEIAELLSNKRSEINDFLNKQKYSWSHLSLHDSPPKIDVHKFGDFESEKHKSLSPYPIILKTDILRFYSSIYTHSIPWALHGKKKSKDNRSVKLSNYYGNRIDQIIRNAQDGQTIGIPTGPITSRLFSEIISIGIERKFNCLLKDTVKDISILRYVDDIYFGIESKEDAETVYSRYNSALFDFQLETNQAKTKIYESKEDLFDTWPLHIRRTKREIKKQPLKNKDFIIFLDYIIKSAIRESNASILRYFIKTLKDNFLLDNYWNEIESFLLKISINFPVIFMDASLLIAYQNNRRNSNVNTQECAKLCHRIIDSYASLGYDKEVTWACWLLEQLGQSINAKQFEVILNYCGPFSRLIAIDLAHNDQNNTKFDKSLVKKKVSEGFPEEGYMIGENWILSYEAERLFNYNFKGNNRYHYKLFGTLIENEVQFYSTELFKNRDLQKEETNY